MIGFFVEPQPDETLYSIFARYADRVQYPSQVKLIRELTGSVNPLNLTLLPGRLGHLDRALPTHHDWSVDALIDEHTLLPFFASFRSRQRVLALRRAMQETNGIKVEAFAGLHASHIKLPQWLRYCVDCAAEDHLRIGFRYWHRIHQLPLIDVCPVHEAQLINTSVSARMRGRWKRLVTADEAIHRSIRRPGGTHDKKKRETILALARDCEWLLQKSCTGIKIVELRQQYLSLLQERQLATWAGRLRRSRIVAEIGRYYTHKFLDHLGCALGKPDRNNWVIRSFHESRIEQVHPLQHLLIIHWLGLSASELMSMHRESLPFGKGPWPCLNRSADHFRKFLIQACRVSRSPKGGVPLGLFSCPACQFTYVRRGPDEGPKDAFRIGKVRIRGREWERNLRSLWMNPAVQFKEMRARLGVCFATIKRQAARLDLPPRHLLKAVLSDRFQGKAA
ncbi:MAG: hypothetical protein UZ03_NOB001002760 [Nitrospira sp. OLB3]|nr:MAG: hypothetical protein UZ03_NOB001002760 [Nitrospira sp. OLB3]